MNGETGTRQTLYSLLIIASSVIIMWGISRSAVILVPFLLSVFLAVIVSPAMKWLMKKGLSSTLAVVIVIIGLVGILSLVGYVVGMSVNSFTESLPVFQQRFEEELARIKETLAGKGIQLNDKAIMNYFSSGGMSKTIMDTLGVFGSLFSNIVLVLLTLAFILLESSTFPQKLRAAVDDSRSIYPKLVKFLSDIKRYMVIQTIISLSVGVLTGIFLAILGVDFPVLMGLLAYLFNYVPNVGSVLVFVPVFLLAFIQFGIEKALIAAAGYILIAFCIGNFVQPKLMGERLGLSTLVVFLSLLFWGYLLGVVGMVLCIPFTLTMKFIFENNENTKWIAVLLGRQPSVEKRKAANA